MFYSTTPEDYTIKLFTRSIIEGVETNFDNGKIDDTFQTALRHSA